MDNRVVVMIEELTKRLLDMALKGEKLTDAEYNMWRNLRRLVEVEYRK